ncbi:MAG: peptide-binding protein [Deltaproteobacteria bacterium]|nr:peptide-binding protein [Deltaproteobacteria bacterium]
MYRKRLVTRILPAILTLVLISCSKNEKQKPAKPFGDTLIIGSIGKASTLNPVLEYSGISAQVKDIIFDGLIRIGKKGEVLPCLAERWEKKEEGREWDFHLRKGVKFHDCHPFTADDVEFTFTLHIDPNIHSHYSQILRQIERVKVKDLYTINIRLIKPSASFLYELTIGILPKHLLEGKDLRRTQFNYKPIGTGPFRLISLSPDKIELRANEDYFLGRPYLDGVVVNLFKNKSIVWANLMKGKIDASQHLEPATYEKIGKVSHLKVYSYIKPFYYLIAYNLTDPLFNDRRVRLALNYAIDKDTIIKKVLRGRGDICSGTILADSWAFNPRVKAFPYDPQKALELLAEAGWQDTDGDHLLDKDKQPFEFQLLLFEGFDEIDAATLMIMEQLSNIGVRVRVKNLSLEALNSVLLSKKNLEAVFIYICSDVDPDTGYRFWHSSQTKGGYNFFSYHNPLIDSLLEQGRHTFNQEQRKRIYDQFQEEMKKDPPGIFLFWRETMLGLHKRFHGVHISSYQFYMTIREWYVPLDEQLRP